MSNINSELLFSNSDLSYDLLVFGLNEVSIINVKIRSIEVLTIDFDVLAGQ
jgi:hypothetical protein